MGDEHETPLMGEITLNDAKESMPQYSIRTEERETVFSDKGLEKHRNV